MKNLSKNMFNMVRIWYCSSTGPGVECTVFKINSHNIIHNYLFHVQFFRDIKDMSSIQCLRLLA